MTEDTCLRLYSGMFFDFFNPRAEQITIEDIARATAHNCRYNGHVKTFYPVAQHCVLASELVPKKFALEGLMHDASEFVVPDMTSPLKHSPMMEVFVALEKTIEKVIAQKYGLIFPYPKVIKKVDVRLRYTEQRDLQGRKPQPDDLYKPYDFKIYPWSPDHARERFIDRFNELIALRANDQRTSNRKTQRTAV